MLATSGTSYKEREKKTQNLHLMKTKFSKKLTNK